VSSNTSSKRAGGVPTAHRFVRRIRETVIIYGGEIIILGDVFNVGIMSVEF